MYFVWSTTFIVIAAMAAALVFCLIKVLPLLPCQNSGSLLFSWLHRFIPQRFLIVTVVLLATCLLLLLPLSGKVTYLGTLSKFWGMAIMGFGLALQSKVLVLSPDATDVAMAMFSGIYNIGIGCGALLGSRVGSQFGFAYIGVVGGMLAAMVLVFYCLTVYRFVLPDASA